MKHAEFVALAEHLMKEVNGSPKALDHYKSMAGTISPESLLSAAEGHFFKHLFDSDDATVPAEKVSLISLKLRHFLASAKKLANQFLDGLSPQSKLILQLIINVMVCNTNKEDGIDQSYRLLSNGPIVSEEKMLSERLRERAREFFMEDLRQIREGLLNGEGRIVKHLLFRKDESKGYVITEPPHQAKYLLNLLGDQIGTFLEGEKVSYDANGSEVEKKLREYTRQEVLNVLYQYNTPEKVINHYLEKFNKR